MSTQPRVRNLGTVEYASTLASMTAFTDRRGPDTPDEIWLLEHPPVFTLGLNGDPAHVLDPGDIPVLRADRGGQVTYHGPGQLVVYVLLDMRRAVLGVRELVTALEQSVIATAADYGIAAACWPAAPGVYVTGAKLASVGLRIRRGCSYHGLAINVSMDLEPFRRIEPCGFADLPVTQLADQGGPEDLDAVSRAFLPEFLSRLGQ